MVGELHWIFQLNILALLDQSHDLWDFQSAAHTKDFRGMILLDPMPLWYWSLVQPSTHTVLCGMTRRWWWCCALLSACIEDYLDAYMYIWSKGNRLRLEEKLGSLSSLRVLNYKRRILTSVIVVMVIKSIHIARRSTWCCMTTTRPIPFDSTCLSYQQRVNTFVWCFFFL